MSQYAELMDEDAKRGDTPLPKMVLCPCGRVSFEGMRCVPCGRSHQSPKKLNCYARFADGDLMQFDGPLRTPEAIDDALSGLRWMNGITRVDVVEVPRGWTPPQGER